MKRNCDNERTANRIHCVLGDIYIHFMEIRKHSRPYIQLHPCLPIPGAGYMKHAECLNTAGDKIHRCMKRLTGILEASAEHHKREHKIGLACCSFGGYRQCIVDAVKGSCDDSHVAYAHDLIQSYAGELLDTVCINYKPGEESCGGLPTLLPKDTPKSLSPIPPLTDVLQVFV
ncbi:unnamed protein product [Ixodes persulcatus]